MFYLKEKNKKKVERNVDLRIFDYYQTFLFFLGIQPRSVTDLYRERNEKKRLEHLELQRNILQAQKQRQQ